MVGCAGKAGRQRYHAAPAAKLVRLAGEWCPCCLNRGRQDGIARTKLHRPATSTLQQVHAGVRRLNVVCGGNHAKLSCKCVPASRRSVHSFEAMCRPVAATTVIPHSPLFCN